MYTEEKLVTPELAKQWLATMGKNRPLNLDRVAQIKNDMKQGNFVLSPQPICFDSSGSLIDGQHRLSAVIQSGVPSQMVVAFDVPQNAVIDRGAPRRSGDSLYMRGMLDYELSRSESISLTNCFLTELRSGANRRTITDADRCKFLNTNGDYVLLAVRISKLGCMERYCKKAGVQAAILGALLKGVSEAELSRFAQCVNTGFIENQHESAAIVLRNYLVQLRLAGGTKSHEVVMYSEMAIRDFCAGINRQRRYLALTHVYISPEPAASKE